jgi:hypothetical protein
MAKKFKAHMMYKGKKSVMAKTMADHLRLKKQGYGHKAPKYAEGGKLEKPIKGGMLNEVTVTAAKSKKPLIRRMTEEEKKAAKFIGGNAPMVGGAKMLGLGKSAFNLLKKAPSLFSKFAPKTAAAAGEALEGAETLRKLKVRRR